MASPLVFAKPGQERKLLIEPALQLTEAVLGAVNKIRTVTRVVMTSSIGVPPTIFKGNYVLINYECN